MSQQPPSKRIFTYPEALSLLPEVRRLTEEAYRRVEDLQGETSDGPLLEETREKAETIIAHWARDITELGVEVKGVWLVDFDSGSGYYCWQYPETGLHHYHSYAGGFRARVPIQ